MNTQILKKRGITVKGFTKRMTNKGRINAASTSNMRIDGRKNDQKDNEEILLDHTPCETLTSYPPFTEANED